MTPCSALVSSVLALAEAPTGFGGTDGPDLTRYLTICGVLLASIGGIAHLFRKLILKTLKQRAAGRSLQVLDVLPLGGKQRLCVVRCYDRTFALGLADHAVNLITELDPVIGEGEVTATPSPADVEAFEDALRKAEPLVPQRRGHPERGVQRDLRRGGVLA